MYRISDGTMFDEMKAWLKTDDVENYTFGYDDPFVDYTSSLYGKAIKKLAKEVGDPTLDVEASIQAARGGEFMTCKNGVTSWDFEDECEELLEIARDEEVESEEDFINQIMGYLFRKWEDCEPEDDEYEDDEDEYENEEDEYEE